MTKTIETDATRTFNYEGLTHLADPAAAAQHDLEEAMSDFAVRGEDLAACAAAIAADPCEPDEVLINAMGTGYVIAAAGGTEEDSDCDEAWERLGSPWCDAYNKAYRKCAADYATTTQESES